MFGGLPGAGATMGTVVNIQTGGRSALSGLTRALILAVVVFGASGLVEDIPKAVLAGIAIKVGIDIIDWAFLRRAHRVSVRGALIMYGVIGMTVFIDLITAVGIGLFVANILTIRRLTDLQSEGVRVIGRFEDMAQFECGDMLEEEKKILGDPTNAVQMLCLSGPLIFGSAQALTRQQTRLADARSLVVDFTNVPHLGVSASLALETTIRDAVQRGCRVYLAGLQEQPTKRFLRLGIPNLVAQSNWIPNRADALKRAVAERAGHLAAATTTTTSAGGETGRPAD
jgi:SulP family sulfate permease